MAQPAAKKVSVPVRVGPHQAIGGGRRGAVGSAHGAEWHQPMASRRWTPPASDSA
jgi:hypothetical protein